MEPEHVALAEFWMTALRPPPVLKFRRMKAGQLERL